MQTSAGELVILDGIDLEINKGENCRRGCFGLGKTTLLGILAGLDATAGSVKLLDANLTILMKRRGRWRADNMSVLFFSLSSCWLR